MKYIEKLIIDFEDTDDLSELKMFPNLKELEINSEIKDLEVLKELDNLRSLKINKLKKGQHLPKFKENNKIWNIYIDSNELITVFLRVFHPYIPQKYLFLFQ